MNGIVRLMALVVSLILTVPALKSETFEYGGLYFSVLAGHTVPVGYTATDYYGVCEVVSPPKGTYSGDIEVPEVVTYNDHNYLVIAIGDDAFSELNHADTVVDATVDTINSERVTSVTLPNSIMTIGDGAFENCHKITSFTIPSNVVSIGEAAFKNTNITTITIPEGVTEIKADTFHGCDKLENLKLPEMLTSIGDNAFAHCEKLTAVKIPEGVTQIGKDAFFFCKSLTSVILPNTLKSIGEAAFEWCSSLKTVVVPNAVESIGESCFEGCTILENVSLGSSLKSIGQYAFEYCDNLKYLTCYNLVPPTVYYNSFDSECYGSTELDVYSNVQSVYSNADVWKLFTRITTGVERANASQLTIEIEGTMVVVSGDAPTLEVYSLDGSLVYRGEATQLTLPRGEYIVRAMDSHGSVTRKVAL